MIDYKHAENIVFSPDINKLSVNPVKNFPPKKEKGVKF